MRAIGRQTAFAVALRPSATLGNAKLNGRAVLVPGGEWTVIRYGAATPPNLTLAFDAVERSGIELRYMSAIPGMPAGTPNHEDHPSAWTRLSGSSAVTGSVRFDAR